MPVCQLLAIAVVAEWALDHWTEQASTIVAIGLAVAFWLAGYGFDVTVVERAPHVRGGGYAVDVRDTAVEVVKRMGIFGELFAARMSLRRMTFVNHDGRKVASVRPSDLFSDVAPDDIDIARGDLCGILRAHTRDDVRYVFNDSIATIEEDESGVDVTFTSGDQQRFDLIVDADGVHSGTRALTFGAEDQFGRYLGYCVAIYRVPNHLGLDNEAIVYNVPGRAAAVGARTGAGLGRADAGRPGRAGVAGRPHRGVGAVEPAARRVVPGHRDLPDPAHRVRVARLLKALPLLKLLRLGFLSRETRVHPPRSTSIGSLMPPGQETGSRGPLVGRYPSASFLTR